VPRFHLRLAPPLAALALCACGPTKEAQAIEQVATLCAAQLGATYQSAQGALTGGYPVGPLCSATLQPMASGDSCGAASAGSEVCRVLYYWFSADPGECRGGACTCELRLRRPDLDAHQGSAEICAVEFVRETESP
jgi:hypothetical protein